METSKLEKFARFARNRLIEQVSTKLELILPDNSLARRESEDAVKNLERDIKRLGKEQVIERVAYILFNRFSALRFMDVNRYTQIGVVSPCEGQFLPEILAEAKMGHIDEEMVSKGMRQKIFGLLDGKDPSPNPQGEAYHLLLIEVCNYWHKIMPFLFESMDSYTELLMPDDLLSENSILSYTREAMTPETCQNVEVIGWLYQYYISEKKDEVFEGLKSNKKITPENIPAATQLFTPHWIVRFLVENSLGRLWMLNHPKSRLIERMDYYIKPEQTESDFLRISKPEEIKICDPACGSGHMLVYAFDLLYAIYEEEGYEPSEIPAKILSQNLFGIEIDERAGELAAFALTMKARAKQRRFFNKPVQPNICVLENVSFEQSELQKCVSLINDEQISVKLKTTLTQFEETDNFGSLIQPELKDVEGIREILRKGDFSSNWIYNGIRHRFLKVLEQCDYLSQKYHVVIANPPYMGGNGMNGELAAWAKENYPASKLDLFAMFIERGLDMVPKFGYSAMVTMQSWMFLSSYENLRKLLMDQTSIECMAHMANMVMGIAFGTAATVWKRGGQVDSRGVFCYVKYDDIGKGNKPNEFPPKNERNQGAVKTHKCDRYYHASAADFKTIPGSPIAYWVCEAIKNLFKHSKIGDICDTRLGMATASNDKFLRQWNEVSFCNFYSAASSRKEAEKTGFRWFPYQKGGDYRKWYGNLDFLVNWENDGYEIRNFVDLDTGKVRSHNYNLDYIFKQGVTWNALSSSKTSARLSRCSLFDNAGSSLFTHNGTKLNVILAYMNSNLIQNLIMLISPTLNYQPGDISRLPASFDSVNQEVLINNTELLISLSSQDWDSFETSWDFIKLPLLQSDYRETTLESTYDKLRSQWLKFTFEMHKLEKENNRIFIDAYGLQDELTPDVPLKEITLICNPHYRYGGNKTEKELEVLLMADTIREFISYAVGCMFGRYALEEHGLILASQGESLKEYLKKIPEPSFPADTHNVVPILEDNWFNNDISERFRNFLRITFGEASYEENLNFIEQAIGKDIRKYFLKDFYSDHVKRYKKRPIYWLFSSPKGSFNALIYMHRYQPDTISVLLNGYLREFRTKLTAKLDHLKRMEVSADVSKVEKTKALKEIENLKKIIDELNTWEHDVIYPLATKQIQIDLDDGVKVNYAKFGAALKKIPGLDSKED